MPATKLKEFLEAKSVKYSVLTHSTAYTAQEIASLAHIRGQELAKTVNRQGGRPEAMGSSRISPG
jgi:Ala-tRNA(Pro) deacylase